MKDVSTPRGISKTVIDHGTFGLTIREKKNELLTLSHAVSVVLRIFGACLFQFVSLFCGFDKVLEVILLICICDEYVLSTEEVKIIYGRE